MTPRPRHAPRPRSTAVLVCLALGLLAAEAGRVPRPADPGVVTQVVHGRVDSEPAAVAALLVRDGPGLAQSCSGALIGCRHVLTAAHCVCEGPSFESCGQPDPADFVVYLQHAGLFDVSAIGVSPDYRDGEAGDAAVLRLATEVERVPTLAINEGGVVPPGTPGTVAGFGVTSHRAFDAGLKRSGQIVTGPCSDPELEAAHVCWRFDAPSGPAGSASNTCFGDSGSPLVADIGDGAVVAGIDSFLFGRCEKNADVFDTSVFDQSGFIASFAGADLDRRRCGGAAHVGDPEVDVSARTGSLGFGSRAQGCRERVARAFARYVEAGVRARQRCARGLAAGRPGPCPDPATAAALEKAAAKLRRALETGCDAEAVQTAAFAGACDGAEDADALASCLLGAGESVIAESDSAFGGLADALSDSAEGRCLVRAARAGARYSRGIRRLADRCRASADRLAPAERCGAPRLGAAQERLRDALSKAVGACGDDAVARLDASGAFDGSCPGATTAGELAACLLADADAAQGLGEGLFLAAESESLVSFDVPSGTALLRVTLNGSEEGGSPFHLRLARGRRPAPGDPSSTLSASFQTIAIPAPQAGTWQALIQSPDGDAETVGPWQLTVTRFP